MPSKPPPLRSPQPRLLGPSAVNWSAVVAAAAVSFALLVSVVAWIVTHPRQTGGDAAPETVLAVPTPSDADAPPPAPPPAARPTDPIEVTPVFHHPDRREVLLKNLPLMMEEAPPLLPPPPPEKDRVKEPVVVTETPRPAPAGETYGTEVLFLNNPAVAAEMAKHDKKLMFVMHISGNFEESCFT